MKYRMYTAVWGDAFTDIFCEYALGNMCGWVFPDGMDVEYTVYTFPAEKRAIEASEYFAELSERIKINFHLIDSRSKKGKYSLSESLTGMEISSFDDDTVHINCPPDMLWSKNTLTTIKDAIEKGYDIIYSPSYRVNLNSFREVFGGRRIPDVSESELAEKCIGMIDRATLRHFADADNFTVWPSVVYFGSTEKNLTAAHFHLHPMAVRNPHKQKVRFSGPIDGKFLGEAYPDKAVHHLPDSSDDLIGYELTDSGYSTAESVNPDGYKANPLNIAFWTVWNTSALSRHIFTVPFQIRGAEMAEQDREFHRRICSLLPFTEFLKELTVHTLWNIMSLKSSDRRAVYGAGETGAYFCGLHNEFFSGGIDYYLDDHKTGELGGVPILSEGAEEDLVFLATYYWQKIVSGKKWQSINGAVVPFFCLMHDREYMHKRFAEGNIGTMRDFAVKHRAELNEICTSLGSYDYTGFSHDVDFYNRISYDGPEAYLFALRDLA